MKIPRAKTSKSNKICPVCGTRLAVNASRCLICGTPLNTNAELKKAKTTGIKPRQPAEVRMGLPVAIGFVLLILALIAAIAYFALLKPMQDAKAKQTPEPTNTKPATLTPTFTITPTIPPLPTWTPEPPIDYVLTGNDNGCIGIAAQFGLGMDGVEAIRVLNNLDINCTLGPAGTVIKVPRPTATASPVPSATPEITETLAPDCTNTISVVADPNTTLMGLAANYNVPMSAIMEYNQMTNDTIVNGKTYIVPLCDRLPTPGPTPTETPPPPYPAPNLLLPASGAAFAADIESVGLQWASVADLRPNEVYRVTVQDLTSPTEKILTEYVADTKFIVPIAFRPQESTPHVIQWTVAIARQINTDATNPVYEEAGAISEKRVFTWIGASSTP